MQLPIYTIYWKKRYMNYFSHNNKLMRFIQISKFIIWQFSGCAKSNTTKMDRKCISKFDERDISVRFQATIIYENFKEIKWRLVYFLLYDACPFYSPYFITYKNHTRNIIAIGIDFLQVYCFVKWWMISRNIKQINYHLIEKLFYLGVMRSTWLRLPML